MRRVMILGSPGSGKSTLARRLGKLLDVPVFHLDRLYHRPAWTSPPDGEFAADVARIAALPAWVIDGNYSSTAVPRVRAADTIIYLDVSRRLAMARILLRVILHYGRQRADAAERCPERFDPEFLRYVWNWEHDVAPRVRWLLIGFPGRTIVLASKRDVRRFAASL